jgi:DnaJ-class molecular chaperone
MGFKLKTCPVCHGSRVVTHYLTGKSMSCSYCRGSGTVIVVNTKMADPEKKKK